MLFKKRNRIMLKGTMTKSETIAIKKIDTNNLVLDFAKANNSLRPDEYHVICYEHDAAEIYKMFNKIREF